MIIGITNNLGIILLWNIIILLQNYNLILDHSIKVMEINLHSRLSSIILI